MKRRIILFISIVLILSLYIERVINISDNDLFPVIQTYNMHDKVNIDDDFFDNSGENMNGYSVTILNAKLLTINNFISQYNVSEIEKFSNSDYILLVFAKFYNISNESKTDAGINLAQYILQESSYIDFIDRDAYPIINEFDSLSFSLALHSEKEVVIPFSINTSKIDINRITNGEPRIVVSLYPNKKMINLDAKL